MTKSPLWFALFLCAATFAAEPATQPVQKPQMVTRAQWGSQPLPIPDSRKQVPRFITIHHAGVPWKAGTDPQMFVKNMQKWGQHREETEEGKQKGFKNWADLPYHFMIAPDGRIFEARPVIYEPESNTKYDLQGHIGVELMGSFGMQRVSQPQLESLVRTVAWLCHEYKIDPSQVAGHMDRAPGQTTCPGKDLHRYIENGQIRAWVTDLLAGKPVNVELGPALDGGPTTMIGEPATRPAEH